MPSSSPSTHAPGWDSVDSCVMLYGASESLCDESVTVASLLKVTSLSNFARVLGVPEARVVLMQGWPQKSCFRAIVCPEPLTPQPK